MSVDFPCLIHNLPRNLDSTYSIFGFLSFQTMHYVQEHLCYCFDATSISSGIGSRDCGYSVAAGSPFQMDHWADSWDLLHSLQQSDLALEDWAGSFRSFVFTITSCFIN